MTLTSLQGTSIEDYGYQLGRAWGIGRQGKNDGALLIVAPNERKVRIEVGYGLEGILTDAASRLIIERIMTAGLPLRTVRAGYRRRHRRHPEDAGGRRPNRCRSSRRAASPAGSEPDPAADAGGLLRARLAGLPQPRRRRSAAPAAVSGVDGGFGVAAADDPAHRHRRRGLAAAGVVAGGGGFGGGGGSFGGGGASGDW